MRVADSSLPTEIEMRVWLMGVPVLLLRLLDGVWFKNNCRVMCDFCGVSEKLSVDKKR